MDLREEYKKSMESSSPDREAMDRMKAAVLAKIAAGEGEPGIPEVNKERKPLPLRRIAYIGGAAAACAVIAVSAATIIPNIRGANDMVSAGESSSAAESGSAASIQASAGADTSGDTGAEAWDTAAPGEIQDSINVEGTASDSAVITWEGSLDDNMPNPEAGYDPGYGQTAEDAPDNSIDVMPDLIPNTGVDSTPNKGSTPPEEPPASDEPDDSASDSITGLPDKGYTGEAWGFGSAEICATGEIGGSSDRNSEMSTEEYCDETAEFGMTLDEALDTEEAAPEREITIVFSGGDWVSYAGERYTLCKRKPPEGTPVNAVDPVTRTHYHVVQSGGTIAVYQSGKLVGVYKK